MLSFNTLRRISKSFDERNATPAIRKADGLSVRDMATAQPIFQHGAQPLPPKDHPLNPSAFLKYHRMTCRLCSASPLNTGSPDDGCYFAPLFRCLTHGWQIPFAQAIRPQYHTDGNYPSMTHFGNKVMDELGEMISQRVLREIPQQEEQQYIFSPMGAHIKSSDKIRAKVLTGTPVEDSRSLQKASDRLEAMGHPKIKVRLTLDPTATGLNAAQPKAPFSYPSLHAFTAIIRRNAFLAVTDISRYYHSFPLAQETRKMFAIRHQGKGFHYARCPFGASLCPFYCSTWSAEFHSWFKAMGIPTAFLMDDWLTVGDTQQEAEQRLRLIQDVFKELGFTIADNKSKVAQTLVLLGVAIDTRAMTFAFDQTQIRGFRTIIKQLQQDALQRQISDHTLWRHAAGKLNWYSEVVQSGRLRCRSTWDFLRHGSNLPPQSQERLLQDLRWWDLLLGRWENASISSLTFKILSPAELLTDKQLFLIQSDASGSDGFGLTAGFLGDRDWQIYSQRWHEDYRPPSSQVAELAALEYSLKHRGHELHDKSLLWISDSQPAVSAINNPKPRSAESAQLLHSIFDMADRIRCNLLALWIPREDNQFPDYLSHLAAWMNRDRVQGQIQLGPQDLSEGATHPRLCIPASCAADHQAVPEFLRTDELHPVPDQIRSSRGIPSSLRPQEQGLRKKPRHRARTPVNSEHIGRLPAASSQRRTESQIPPATTGIRRHQTSGQKAASNLEPDAANCRPAEQGP